MPPSNDDWANAQLITGASGSTTGDNTGATAEVGEAFTSAGGDGPWQTIWFKWVAPDNNSVIFHTQGSRHAGGTVGLDTILGVWVGSSLAGLTEITSNDDYGPYSGLDNFNSRVQFTPSSGTTYYIQVGGYDNTEFGNVALAWGGLPQTATPNVTAPTSGQVFTRYEDDTPTTIAVTVDWDNISGQTSYEARILDDTSTVVDTSGTVISSLSAHVFTLPFGIDGDFTAEVRARQDPLSFLLSNWASVPFHIDSVSLSPHATPVVTSPDSGDQFNTRHVSTIPLAWSSGTSFTRWQYRLLDGTTVVTDSGEVVSSAVTSRSFDLTIDNSVVADSFEVRVRTPHVSLWSEWAVVPIDVFGYLGLELVVLDQDDGPVGGRPGILRLDDNHFLVYGHTSTVTHPGVYAEIVDVTDDVIVRGTPVTLGGTTQDSDGMDADIFPGTQKMVVVWTQNDPTTPFTARGVSYVVLDWDGDLTITAGSPGSLGDSFDEDSPSVECLSSTRCAIGSRISGSLSSFSVSGTVMSLQASGPSPSFDAYGLKLLEVDGDLLMGVHGGGPTIRLEKASSTAITVSSAGYGGGLNPTNTETMHPWLFAGRLMSNRWEIFREAGTTYELESAFPHPLSTIYFSANARPAVNEDSSYFFTGGTYAWEAFPPVEKFDYTGAYQEYVVPSGVDQLYVSLEGAPGGAGSPFFFSNRALQAVIRAFIDVTPGETLRVYVGGHPADSVTTGGWNGGGDGGGSGTTKGGGGGGGTDIRRAPYGLADRIIVAAGGGGAGYRNWPGGEGGVPTTSLNGTQGQSSSGEGGLGGTLTEGGAAGDAGAIAGGLGTGGNGATDGTIGGGGGGGGIYGGGGGGTNSGSDNSGGGGGSSGLLGPGDSVTYSYHYYPREDLHGRAFISPSGLLMPIASLTPLNGSPAVWVNQVLAYAHDNRIVEVGWNASGSTIVVRLVALQSVFNTWAMTRRTPDAESTAGFLLKDARLTRSRDRKKRP